MSKSVVAAATAREDSRGAHYRADFPDVRDLENSTYTVVRFEDGDITLGTEPVDFSRIKPGDSLLDDSVA